MSLDECTAQSMALYAFPCPPLPQFVLRGEDHEMDTVSSHDLLMTGMNFAKRKSETALALQVESQHALQAAYNARLDALFAAYEKEGKTAHIMLNVYNAFQQYTRASIAAYLGKSANDVDVRFAPLDSVPRGGLLHQRAAEHLALHRALVGDESLQLRHCLAMDYEDLLCTFFRLYCLEAAPEPGGAPEDPERASDTI